MKSCLVSVIAEAMLKDRYVVIMAGGKGERFWPQSRLARPKHLLPIVGEKPMLAQTVDRLEGLVSPERVIIVTNKEQRAAVVGACPSLPPENVVAEPVGRDTAAAVGLAGLLVKQRNHEASFAILPADHVIHDAEGFRKILLAAFEAAEKGSSLVTIGIAPDYPATGYGYIQRDSEAFQCLGKPVYSVKRFVEKPDLDIARTYLEEGGYFWNAGMFVWKVETILNAIRELAPKLHSGLSVIQEKLETGMEVDRILEEVYPGLEKISVDYAIMEKARGVLTIESDFDWDDVGEWPSIARHLDPDEAGNVRRGLSVLHEARGNIVVGEKEHLVTLVGVDDLIVVQTPDATLVCPKDRAQEIKDAVKKIGAEEALREYL